MRLENSGKLRKPSERLSVEQADDPTTTERSPVDGPEELTGWGSKAAGEAAEADRGTPPALCGSDDVDRAKRDPSVSGKVKQSDKFPCAPMRL
jgi:hypothetical protein